MDFNEKIKSNNIVIFSKNNCTYCNKLFEFLGEKVYYILKCDDYLINQRDDFLLKIEELAGKEWKTFPICFIEGKFIGGYTDVVNLYQNQVNFEEDF